MSKRKILVDGAKIIAWGARTYSTSNESEEIFDLECDDVAGLNKDQCYWDGTKAKPKTEAMIFDEAKMKEAVEQYEKDILLSREEEIQKIYDKLDSE